MKSIIYIFLFAMITACGSAGAGESMPPGISVSQEYKDLLKKSYETVEECTGLKGESFESLSIEVFPEQFPCESARLCFGEYQSPNTLRISYPGKFPHEMIHYLLYVQTGNLDPNHESPLFKQCEHVLVTMIN